MKKTNIKLVDRLIIISLIGVFGFLGLAIAYSQFMVYEPPWQTRRLPTPPDGVIQILQVELHSFGDDPTGDRVFVETDNGLIYSHTLFEDSWLAVDEVPDSDFHLSESCAPEWPGAQSDSHIWDPPPVEKEVRDSAGERIEHAIAIFVRCYVLSEDGSLELWTMQDSALGAIAFMQCGPFYALIGGLLGFMIGALVVWIRRRGRAEIKTPANTA